MKLSEPFSGSGRGRARTPKLPSANAAGWGNFNARRRIAGILGRGRLGGCGGRAPAAGASRVLGFGLVSLQPRPALFGESDPRTDIQCALTHLQAARVRLERHPADNVMRELVRELDVALVRLGDLLRNGYPLGARQRWEHRS